MKGRVWVTISLSLFVFSSPGVVFLCCNLVEGEKDRGTSVVLKGGDLQRLKN